MNRKKVLAVLVTLSVVCLLIFSTPIAAKGGDNTSRPGNGHGDSKHEHLGPPGHSDSDDRPGYGYGDRNHYHYGYSYHYSGSK